MEIKEFIILYGQLVMIMVHLGHRDTLPTKDLNESYILDEKTAPVQSNDSKLFAWCIPPKHFRASKFTFWSVCSHSAQ